jgi:hypothetical protein
MSEEYLGRKNLIVKHEATEQAPVAFHERLNMDCLFH